MRTLIALFSFIILALCIHNTADNAWTDKRMVDARITEKWEDWSGEARHPYKVLFAVTITDNRSVTGPITTTYFEKGYLNAHEWLKAVPGETVRQYKTSYKDLGVQPTYTQKERDRWNSVWLFCLCVIWPFLVVILLLHWMESY